MQAIVEIKQVYGNELIYPVNDVAQKLANLAGTKTLQRDTIKIAKELGFTFTQKQREI